MEPGPSERLMAPTRASASKALEGAAPPRGTGMSRTWPAQRARSSSPAGSTASTTSRRSPHRGQPPRRRAAAAKATSVSSAGSRSGNSSWKGGLRGSAGPDTLSSLRSDRLRQRRDGSYDDTAVVSAIEALRKHTDRVGGAVDEVDDRLALAIRDLSIDIDAAGQAAHEDVDQLGAQTDGRFERMDSWINQLEHKLERCDSLASNTQSDHSSELHALRERTGTVENELNEAKNAFEDQSRLVDQLQARNQAFESQLHGHATETREGRKQVAKATQDQTSATRDLARKVETMASSYGQLEAKLESVEIDAVGMRRFSDRLQECEQVKARMVAMEKREREQSQRMQQLESLVETLQGQAQRNTGTDSGLVSPVSDSNVQAELSQIRMQLEPLSALTGRVESQAMASRRLADQLAEIEASHSDRLHQDQTDRQELQLEIESVSRTLSTLSNRVSEQQSATQAFTLKEQMRANRDGAGSSEMMAVLERVACVEQVLKIGETSGSLQKDQNAAAEASVREELLNTVAELHGRVVSMESETKRSTITAQSTAAAANKKVRELQASMDVLEAQVRDSTALVHSGLLKAGDDDESIDAARLASRSAAEMSQLRGQVSGLEIAVSELRRQEPAGHAAAPRTSSSEVAELRAKVSRLETSSTLQQQQQLQQPSTQQRLALEPTGESALASSTGADVRVGSTTLATVEDIASLQDKISLVEARAEDPDVTADDLALIQTQLETVRMSMKEVEEQLSAKLDSAVEEVGRAVMGTDLTQLAELLQKAMKQYGAQHRWQLDTQLKALGEAAEEDLLKVLLQQQQRLARLEEAGAADPEFLPKLQAHISTVESTVASLSDREDDTDSSITALQEQIAALEKQHTALDDKTDACEQTVSLVKDRVTTTESLIGVTHAASELPIAEGVPSSALSAADRSTNVKQRRAVQRESARGAADETEAVTAFATDQRANGGVSMVSRLDETAVEVKLLQQRVGRMEEDKRAGTGKDTEALVTLASFEQWTAEHEERVRVFNSQVETHEANLDRMNAEHAQRLDLLERRMVAAIASATAIADTVKHEHTELSGRIDWTDSQCDDLKVTLAAQVEALGVSIKMHGVKSGDDGKSFPGRTSSSRSLAGQLDIEPEEVRRSIRELKTQMEHSVVGKSEFAAWTAEHEIKINNLERKVESATGSTNELRQQLRTSAATQSAEVETREQRFESFQQDLTELQTQCQQIAGATRESSTADTESASTTSRQFSDLETQLMKRVDEKLMHESSPPQSQTDGDSGSSEELEREMRTLGALQRAMQEAIKGHSGDLADQSAALEEHCRVAAASFGSIEERLAAMQLAPAAPAPAPATVLAPVAQTSEPTPAVVKSLARLEEGFEEMDATMRRLQQELQEHSAMAAAAAAWPSDVAAVDSRLTASIAELRTQLTSVEAAVAQTDLVDQLCADVEGLIADASAAAAAAGDSSEAVDTRLASLDSELEELRQDAASVRSLAASQVETADERHQQLSQKMAVATASSMAIAETVRSEHTELSTSVDSSHRQLQELSERLNAKIDALAVTMKLAGIDAGYESKTKQQTSSDSVKAVDIGDGDAQPSPPLKVADEGAVVELAGKVDQLLRAQAEHEVALANCEASTQLKASKEDVATLSERFDQTDGRVKQSKEDMAALSERVDETDGRVKQSTEAQAALRSDVARLSSTAAKESETQAAANAKVKEEISRVRILPSFSLVSLLWAACVCFALVCGRGCSVSYRAR